MNCFSKFSRFVKCTRAFRAIIIFSIFLFCLSGISSADNFVSWQMVKQGTTVPIDTIYVGGNYQFQISIENDVRLGGMHLNIKIFSTDGTIWDYPDSILSVVPNSRIDGAWDMTGLSLTKQNFDGAFADSFAVGGVALHVGMDIGPLEPMFGFNFTPMVGGQWANGLLGEICIEEMPYFVLADPNIFVTESGAVFEPDFAEGSCWPVVMICGNPNGDDDINVGDPIFMINHIFRNGAAPNPYMLGDANLDGAVNVADIMFLIKSAFRTGPNPDCPAG